MLKCPNCYSEHMRMHSHTSAGKQRYSCRDCGHRTVKPIGVNDLDSGLDQKLVAKKIRRVSKKKKKSGSTRYFITCAQNATPVPAAHMSSVLGYCEDRDAELIIIPSRYRNPTSVFTDEGHDWWAPETLPYLMDRRVDLCDKLTLLADIKVQPTAARPLTSMEGFSGTKSCIVGHPKAQMVTVATRAGDLPKIMQTTGSITLENYTNSRAGAVGKHHHIMGGLVVEIDNVTGDFHMRRVSMNSDGTFYDLDRRYGPEGLLETNVSASALVLGDLHQWWLDDEVSDCIKEEIVPLLNPDNIVLHDVIDFYSRSHHHEKAPFTRFAKHQNGMSNVLSEIVDFVNWAQWIDTNVVITPSNHHEHFKRWIEEADWRQDPENAEVYLETALHMVRETKMTREGTVTPDPFKWWMTRLAPYFTVLDVDSSFMVNDVELGMHGHYGPSGSRGSPMNLSKLGVKCIIGHGHSPTEFGSCLAVGVLTANMEYANGPSSWLPTSAIVYPDGKRTLIHAINGKITC